MYMKLNNISVITERALKNDGELLRHLNSALLEEYFNLKVDQPEGSLIPTLGLRLNYLLNVKDIVDRLKEKDDLIAVDIGSGSSCVHPLLMSKMMSSTVKIFATECNTVNFEYSLRNIEQNNIRNISSNLVIYYLIEATYYEFLGLERGWA